MYITWATFNNVRLLLMACMPVIIFYLIWLVNTSEGIRSEEGTLLDLVCWPDGNAIPVIITCGSIIAVVIELYGLYQLFKAGLSKLEYDVTNGLYYYVWALIIMINIFLGIMFYSGLQSTIIRAKIKGGITTAMLRYASHLPSKVAIDKLQTRFHCCGRVSYHEWFYIPWFKTEESVELNKFPYRKFVADNVPYSCCSMDSLCPCIHHGVMQLGGIYKYDPKKQLTIWEAGCEDKLISEMMSVSRRFNAVMTLVLIAMLFVFVACMQASGSLGISILANSVPKHATIIVLASCQAIILDMVTATQSDLDFYLSIKILQVIAVRYLHTAYKNGLHAGNQIVCKSYLLRSLTDIESPKSIRRKEFRKKKFRQARTLQWVTTAYRSGKRDCHTFTNSDHSSDELLKPIYE